MGDFKAASKTLTELQSESKSAESQYAGFII
jgi:hypothetical protein